jgi:hypothetical protein
MAVSDSFCILPLTFILTILITLNFHTHFYDMLGLVHKLVIASSLAMLT